MTAGRTESHRAASSAARALLAARFGLACVAGVALLVLCELILAAVAAQAAGWSADVVMSGSMAPGILPGDLVLTQPATAAQLRPGQVVLVRDPAHPERLLMHRLVERRPDGSLVTKGDANADADSTPVPADSVRGLPRLRLPYLGLPQLWLALGQYHLVTGFGLGLTVAVGLVVPGRRRPAAGSQDRRDRRVHGRHRGRHFGRHRRPPPGHRRPSPARPTGPAVRTVGTAVALAGLMVAGLAADPSRATFKSTANTGTNSITAGTVSFGANSPTSASFTVSNAIPGSTGTSCVKVTYVGTLTATVRVYVAPGNLTGTGLGSYLTFQLNEGTGNNADCSDFASAANDYNSTGMSATSSTIATFAGADTSFASGAGNWSATTNATRTYQFVWQLGTNNSAAGTNMSVTFTWEAQN